MFEVGDKVECLIFGKGTVNNIDEKFIYVNFGNQIKKYDLNGVCIDVGATGITLFKNNVVIVADNALFDINRIPIKDQDAVLVDNKQDGEFKLMFYFSKENAFKSKNDTLYMDNISSKMMMYRLDNNIQNDEFIVDNRNNVRNNINKKQNEIIVENKLTVENENKEEKEIVKISEDKNEKIEHSLPIVFDNAKIIDISNSKVVNKVEDGVVFNNIKLTANVTFEIANENNMFTYITLSGVGENVYKRSIVKQDPKDYIEITDCYIYKRKLAEEDEYIFIDKNVVKMDIVEDKIRLSLR